MRKVTDQYPSTSTSKSLSATVWKKDECIPCDSIAFDIISSRAMYLDGTSVAIDLTLDHAEKFANEVLELVAAGRHKPTEYTVAELGAWLPGARWAVLPKYGSTAAMAVALFSDEQEAIAYAQRRTEAEE